ncbi:hypothetical protein Moror_2550 [Moniliophthora roreri MCA 2997]|uniref:Uncharacterized protein n=1 Tax=Moniliophthora roreri (strain MCA 2997) TaxID=1381753 RepID=V2WXH6_MONRO|nr:hypothetical protein Moror_2550 [Moniliophthora roreri MCA 2997]
MFNVAQDISINGNATNAVHRDQYNGTTTIINRIIRVGRPGRTIAKRGRKRHDVDSEYGQYREIIRGDIYKLEQICEDNRNWEWEDGHIVQKSCRRTVHQARVYGDDRVFTAISYHGQDAKKIWKKEFTKCSQADDPVLLQLFAINRSNVPTLLFYDEWLPLGHLYSKQRLTPNTHESKLWINSRTGRVSSGPAGPLANKEYTRVPYNCEDMPSAMEMATADTCVRFFNETGAGYLDFDVLQYAWSQSSLQYIESLLGIDSPDDHTHSFWRRDTCRGLWYCDTCGCTTSDEVQDFICKLRFDTVYSGTQLDKIAGLKEGVAYRWAVSAGALSNETLIDSGLTRFQFDVGFRRSCYIYFDTSALEEAWLSQVHGLDRSTSGPETCFIPVLVFDLQLEPRPEQPGVLDFETLPIVYLFLRPPPLYLANIDSWLSQVSFWSFDKNGTTKIPEMECKHLGLPYTILGRTYFCLYTRPKYVYDGLHAWQVARDFDPTTTDFARSLGLPILEPAITRFESVVEEEEPSQDNASDETITEKEETIFSQIGSWFSWTATPQSDFSAVAV